MVAVSFVLVLALVSSIVVAQPGIDDSTEILTESVYEWVPPSEETPTPTSDQDPADIGLSYILQQLNLQPDKFTRRTNFTDRFGVTHLSPTIPKSTVEISFEDAVKVAVDSLGVPLYNAIAPVKKSYKTGNGKILVWKFQLRDNPTTQWIEVKVNANTGVIVSKKDVKRKFTYAAIKLPNENPRSGFSKIVYPENLQASPNGWTDGYRLKGNNAEAIFEGDMTFETATRGRFKGTFDPTLPPQVSGNLVAGAVNAFYVTNMVHDVLYPYGFNEPAGNFQRDNFGRGGIAGDPVIINLQDSKTENYVSFDTPPDGRSGVLNLHIFTTTKPNRDPALDNNVMIHELTHGLSSRLTGGAQTKMCMSKIESRGLSEGYSDVMALIFMAKPEDTCNTEKVIAEYVEGSSQGVRKYPYTTNMRINPLTYQDAVGEKQRHRLGEIWAAMLWEVYWNLVEEYGFSANLHDATQEQGNIIFLQLFVGTLMIQPCNPTFESAYDAMLAADAVYYGGIHKHLIRKGFAKRGLDPVSQSDPTMDRLVWYLP
ncbi:hypothetical protein BSLG_010756 [Batrachochytrium salamandrivorans]|nr:hypothetical protein BSLG_010756 [Batrachochytrium salamandrivorans]